MEALKKDYDGGVINTTKEATAKIMNVESMEHQNQKKMHEEKEEVLQMLVRFKAMEAKIVEMEITSFNQRKQIEELEARLQKTEYVANDLRSELKETKKEMEELKNSRAHPLDKQNVKGSVGFNEDASQENQMISSGSFQLDPWDSGPALLSPSNKKDARLPTAIGHCSSVSGNVSIPTTHQGNLAEENKNTDQLSILRRKKEPQLNRSDCTRKVRATGKTRPTGKLSHPVHANQSSSKRNKAGNVGPKKKNPTQLQELLQEGNSLDKGQDLTPSGVPSRKRGITPKRSRSTLFTNQITESPLGSALSHCRTSPYPDNAITKTSGKEAPREIKATSQSSSMSPMVPVPSFTTTNTVAKLGSAVDVQTGTKGIKAKGTTNAVSGSQVLIDELNLTTPNTQNTNILETADDKPLKYTFQRKRKRASLCSPDGSTNLATGTTKKKQSEMQSNGPEPQKSSLVLESSHADQQVVQVARQLISLKENKRSD
ncbi:hypothetical protein AQUCO_02500169v1 [Aquilegia coerulea]|uniref:Uncharacterized protein n=1 Tax=Aquilegia coerulea TaxID=218851 RepID=A0A2G5D9U8_AQUCA|nr:hypothetical protein AQUCO_02500169v1 [Aquilegia coerulea]